MLFTKYVLKNKYIYRLKVNGGNYFVLILIRRAQE